MQTLHLTAERLRDTRYVIRPFGTVGSCGFFPQPWDAQFVNARSEIEAIRKARPIKFLPGDKPLTQFFVIHNERNRRFFSQRLSAFTELAYATILHESWLRPSMLAAGASFINLEFAMQMESAK